MTGFFASAVPGTALAHAALVKRTYPGVKQVLRRIFGIGSLRPGQREVIERVMRGEDVLAVMPSGAGKSLCYQVPALCLRGTTVVVSPLIALMKDQADKLEAHGVKAAALSSALSEPRETQLLEEIARRRTEIVYTTPERLAAGELTALLKRHPIDLLVIDEAHCLSQWGHDFRPAYLEIRTALAALGNPPLLGLTATATDEVIEDIKEHLGRPRLRVVNTGVYRPNLRYAVFQVTNDEEHREILVRLVREERGPGIVYAATVQAAKAAHAVLGAAGENALLYHGRLAAKERSAHQDAFMQGEARLMVATNAFGMGVDKPDIRFIVHFQVPGSLEAYYQESGRAGRDGRIAHCSLLYDHRDRRIQRYLTAGGYPDLEALRTVRRAMEDAGGKRATLARLREAGLSLPQTKARVALALIKEAGVPDEAGLEEIAEAYREKAQADRRKLERMTFYAQAAFCRWKMMVEYFNEQVPWERCGNCDNCRRFRPQERHADTLKLSDENEGLLHRGDDIDLPGFGRGRITALHGEEVHVAFPDGTARRFLRRYVEAARSRAG